MQRDSSRPYAITERTFLFAQSVVTACLQLDNRSWVARTMGSQLLRSATSVGANIEEGQGAHSRADFISKNVIALKEARETLYWLALLQSSGLLSPPVATQLIDEARQ